MQRLWSQRLHAATIRATGQCHVVSALRGCVVSDVPAVSSSLSVDRVVDNSSLLVGEWELALEEKFGTGTHRLRRALFREYCDEMRGEVHTKPPAPHGKWRVAHEDGTDVVTFSLAREHTIDGVEISIVGRLFFKDPPGKGDFCTIVDNHFVHILMERNGVVVAYEAAMLERVFEIKNIKVLKRDFLRDIGIGEEDTLANTAARLFERKELIYDGPCIHHLEDDLYGELHDMLITANIDLEFQEFVVRWISYLEHVEYLRWNLSIQESVLAGDGISVEELITEAESEIVNAQMDNWRRDPGAPTNKK